MARKPGRRHAQSIPRQRRRPSEPARGGPRLPGPAWNLLISPLRPSVSLILSVLAFAGALMLFAPDSYDWLNARWKVDEAHKISETKALSRYLHGRFHDAVWFEPVEARVNPSVAKFVAGAVILLSGNAIPENSGITWVDNESYPPSGSEELYLRARPALRRLSLAVTAAIFALLTFLAVRCGGLLAAAIMAWPFVHHLVPRHQAIMAMNDPLQALLVLASLIPLLWLEGRNRPRGQVALLAAASGLFAAAAFQTKLSGALAAVAAAAACLVVAPRGFRIAAVAILAASATLFVLAVNPLYWAESPAPLPESPLRQAGVLLRPLDRLALQLKDAEVVLGRFESIRLTTMPERLAFVREAVFRGYPGVALLTGLVMAFAFRRRQSRALLVWGAVVVAGFSLWVPLPWPRYLYPMLGPAYLLAGLGWNAIAQRLSGRGPAPAGHAS